MRTDKPYSLIKVEPIAGHLGAEIAGVDLAKLDDRTFAEIKRAWLENLVIFFRDQNVTPAIMESMGQRFGQLSITSYTNSVPGHQFAHCLVREADVGKGERNFGDFWHMDQTVRPVPTAGFMLYAVESPPYGGDTGFSSMYSAYDYLSDELKACLESLSAVHTWEGKSGFPVRLKAKGWDVYLDGLKRFPPVTHPVVMKHPITGRKALFVNETFTTHIEGLHIIESDNLLKMLFNWIQQPEFQVQHKWELNGVAIWDNYSTQHYAFADYWPARRVNQRLTVAP